MASDPSTARPSIVGPDSGPEAPFPLRMEGTVIKGFGRGSKELGIPTANLPVDDKLTPWISDIKSGIYFGWSSVHLPSSHPQCPKSSTSSQKGGSDSLGGANGFTVYPMVMSIGYNPFYGNTTRSAEVHVLHDFGGGETGAVDHSGDFYGSHMRLVVAGYVRPERDYASLDALVADIRFDCVVARNSVARPAWTPRLPCASGEEDGGAALDGGEWLVSPLPEGNASAQ